MVQTSESGTAGSMTEPGATGMADLDALIRDRVDSMVAAKVDELFAIKESERAKRPRKMAIIATKGTLDWAYPPLILATTGATLGWDVGIFFTFYGLKILQKDANLEIGTVGNPAMPMPVPMPQFLTALPGMTPMASSMMKRQFKAHGVASIKELLDLAVEMGVKLSPCGMTMDVFGFEEKSFIDGTEPVCGATHFLSWAADADIALFT